MVQPGIVASFPNGFQEVAEDLGPLKFCDEIT